MSDRLFLLLFILATLVATTVFFYSVGMFACPYLVQLRG